MVMSIGQRRTRTSCGRAGLSSPPRCPDSSLPWNDDELVEPMSDLNSGKGLRVGTGSLDRDKPLWRQPHQADHICDEADLWLLTRGPRRPLRVRLG